MTCFGMFSKGVLTVNYNGVASCSVILESYIITDVFFSRCL